MYVRLISYHIKPWVTESHAEPVYNEMLNAMKPLRGFCSMSLLLNEETHRAVSLSYWEDQESASEAGPKILPLLLGRAETLVDSPPEVSGFELVRQEASPAEPAER